MALPLKLMRKGLQPCNAQMEMSSTIQNNQVSPQQGHKHLKYNQSKHKYKSQQADRKTLCTKSAAADFSLAAVALRIRHEG
jgi:hypothetical protein